MAVSIARSEYLRGAPRLPLRAGVHDLIASSEIHSVISPRWTRALSYSAQLAMRDLVLYLGWMRDFMPLASAADARPLRKRPSRAVERA
jgi:hypothetical protein